MCSYPSTTNPGYPNETEAQEEDFKFNLMKLIKAFKEDMNKFLKEIHENTFKQAKALKEEANKHKEIQENIVKQVKDMNKTVQDLKGEIEVTKKTQTEIKLEMEYLGKITGTADHHPNNTRDGRENFRCTRYSRRN